MNLQKSLKERLESAQRIAIMGIGSELLADDSAGILIIESLQRDFKKKKPSVPVTLINGCTVPENFTGVIRKFNPTHIILIDIVDAGKKSGTCMVLNADEELKSVSFSTHRLPLKVMIEYLRASISCSVTLIGIQPKTIRFNMPVSLPVKKAVKEVTSTLTKVIRSIVP